MKQLCRLLCIPLALLVLASVSFAAADAAFTFRNGIGWSTTPAEMLAAEGVHDYDANVQQRNVMDRFVRYYIQRDSYSESPFFVYHAETPVLMYLMMPADTRAVHYYDDQKAEYDAKLGGEPLDYTVDDIYALQEIIWPSRTERSAYERATCWRLPDGTLAVLLTVSGENYIMYFNEDILRSLEN